jgi:membrane-associated phospholipid phosphatase
VLKDIIGSPRPFDALSVVHPLFPESGFGFPSGHATFFSALAASMYLYHKKLGIVLAIGALLIGLSRIIGGVHFPFDILGGFIVGPIVAVISYRMLRWFGKKYDLL